jgi:hypothetical protein
MVAQDEVLLKIFGPDSSLRIQSKTTLAATLAKVQEHHEVCCDPTMRGLLAGQGVVGRQASKIRLLSIPALLGVMRLRGASRSMRTPLEMLDYDALFEQQLSGGLQPLAEQSGTDTESRQPQVDDDSLDDEQPEDRQMQPRSQVAPAAPRQPLRAQLSQPRRAASRITPLRLSRAPHSGWHADDADSSEDDLHVDSVRALAAVGAAADDEWTEGGGDDDDELFDPDASEEDARLARALRKEADAISRRMPFPCSPLSGSRAATAGRYTSSQLTQRFGLTDRELKSMRGLSREVSTLMFTAADPGINLLRTESFGGPLAPSTLDRLRKDVLKYLGFLANIRDMGNKRLTLSLFGNKELFLAYLEFLDARGVRTAELLKQVQVAIKVNSFLSSALQKDDNFSLQALNNPHEKVLRHFRTLQRELHRRERRHRGADVR